MPKVSIIVPLYNKENTIRKCLDTIEAQTYKDFEVIIVNDGSTDKSPEICEEYSKRDDRFVIYTQKNMGVACARNTGLRLAKGEYLGFVDPDDFIEPRTYEIAVQFMTDDVDCVIWDVIILFAKDPDLYYEYFKVDHFGKTCLTDDNRLSMNTVLWNKLFRKSIIDKYDITFPIGKLYEDDCFWHKYTMWCKNVYILPLKNYDYCIFQESLRGQVSNLKLNVDFDREYIVEDVLDYCVEHNILRENWNYLNKLYFSELKRACRSCYRRKLLIFLFRKLSIKMYNRFKQINFSTDSLSG